MLALTFQGSYSHIKWGQFYNGMEHFQVADGGDGLLPDMYLSCECIWTANKGWSSIWVVGQGLTTPLSKN